MDALIKMIRQDGQEFEVIIEVASRVKAFRFPLNVADVDITNAIRQYLTELNQENRRLVELREKFVGTTISVGAVGGQGVDRG